MINCLSGCKGEFPDVSWNFLNSMVLQQKNVYLIKELAMIVIQNVIQITLNLINIMLWK